MANYIDEFLIAIGLDAEELSSGIESVRQRLAAFAGQAAEDMEGVADASKQAARVSALSFDKSRDRVGLLGDAAKEAASAIESAFTGLSPVFSQVTAKLGAVAAAFALVTGGAQAFSNYVEESDALGKLSVQLGISVDKLDAFGKAAEAMGGSAQSLFASMRSYYEQTGRPAEEVFQLASKVEGMSRGAAQRFLQAQGIASDAIPVFLEGQKAMDDLMAKYRQTAFTQQDAKTARAFKVAWQDFKTAAQSAGNVLVRLIAPVLTKMLDGLSRLVFFIKDNARAFGLMDAGVAAAFAAKNIGAIKKAVVAVRLLGASIKMAALPITALAAGIAVVAIAIDDFAGFVDGADSLMERMLRKFGQTDEQIESLREGFKLVGDALGGLWDLVKPFLGGALEYAFKAIGAALLIVVGVIEGVILGFAVMIRTGKRAGEAIADAFGKAIDWVSSLINSVADFGADFVKWFGELPGVVSQALSAAWEDLKNWFGQWNALIDDVVGELQNGIDGFGSSLIDSFSAIPDAIASALSSAWDYVVGWFGQWTGLIKDVVGKPIKDLFGGIGSFFGLGDDEETEGAKAVVRERETVAAKQAAYQAAAPNVTTNASMNVVNNISTRDNPQAIGRAVENSVAGGFNRQAALIGQSMVGVNLK